jgi:AcrR family transcriptional regulator
MRITAEAREATRVRILDVAQRLFREKGFDQATIRDIARGAGLATGTLFNYFPSKEEVAAALAHELADKARRDFLRKRRDGAALAEELFLQVAAQLRAWKPLRKFIQPVIETALASPAPAGGGAASAGLRSEHVEAVAAILSDHGVDPDRWTTAAPIYWALYVGVLSFWSRDASPTQEDTLAMLDHSINMFVAWLQPAG